MATSFTTHSAGQVITHDDVNLIQTAVNTLENTPAGGADPSPPLQGFTAWAFDPVALSSAGQAQTAGTMTVVKMNAPVALSVTKGYFMTAQATTTPTGCYGAIYNSAGTQLGAISANASAQLTGAALITLTFSTISVPVGVFYLGFWQVAGAAASVLSATSGASIVGGEYNLNLTSTAYRSAIANTALTTSAPGTVGPRTTTAKAVWAAVS